MEMVLNHDKGHCILSESNISSTESEFLAARQMEEMDEPLSEENTEFSGLEIQINYIMPYEEMLKLPIEFQTMCNGFPTYSVTKTESKMNKGEFMQSLITREEQNSTSTRQKRDADLQFSTCSHKA